MTRDPSSSTRLAILMVFLKNDNQPLNVRRLASKVKDVGLWKFTKSSENEANPVDPSIPSVSSACQDLFAEGLLEVVKARPPRSSTTKRTPHYRLPVKDLQKVMKAILFLLSKLGPQLINSAYGQKFAPRVVMVHLQGFLDAYGIQLTKEEKENVIRIIDDSPTAMRRALDQRVMDSLKRLTGGKEEKQALVDALISYLNAARIIDIADDNNRIESKTKAIS